jgi:murein hydrolase activator
MRYTDCILPLLVFLLLQGLPGVAPETMAQKGGTVKSRQAELKRLRDEIRSFERQIKDNKRRESSTIQRLDDIDKQTTLIRTLLARLTEDIAQNQKEIAVAQLNLGVAENELKQLKREYARTVVNMYRRGRTHDTELLLSAGSLNELFIRSRYLKAYSERARLDAERIRLRREKIALQKALLEQKLEEQRKSIRERQNEEQHLRRRTQEQQQLLARVRQDRQSVEEQLRRKRQAAERVERIIADLIERERKRLEEERRKKAAASGKKKDAELPALPSVPIANTAIGKLKGRLPWPVPQGAVVGFFGENLNPSTGTVTVSPGIDIAAPLGSSVRSVADGKVAMVEFIAGYGSLVIIEHADGFFTVYAHLSRISVKKDQKVKAGQEIAKSGEGISGPRLHFELWYKRQKQDPLQWLSKR